MAAAGAHSTSQEDGGLQAFVVWYWCYLVKENQISGNHFRFLLLYYSPKGITK